MSIVSRQFHLVGRPEGLSVDPYMHDRMIEQYNGTQSGPRNIQTAIEKSIRLEGFISTGNPCSALRQHVLV